MDIVIKNFLFYCNLAVRASVKLMHNGHTQIDPTSDIFDHGTKLTIIMVVEAWPRVKSCLTDRI